MMSIVQSAVPFTSPARGGGEGCGPPAGRTIGSAARCNAVAELPAALGGSPAVGWRTVRVYTVGPMKQDPRQFRQAAKGAIARLRRRQWLNVGTIGLALCG